MIRALENFQLYSNGLKLEKMTKKHYHYIFFFCFREKVKTFNCFILSNLSCENTREHFVQGFEYPILFSHRKEKKYAKPQV